MLQLVRHQHRYGHTFQQGTRYTAKYLLTKIRGSVATHNQDINIIVRHFVENNRRHIQAPGYSSIDYGINTVIFKMDDQIDGQTSRSKIQIHSL